jgi:hypothetical protein
MVEAVRAGHAVRAASRHFRVSRPTVDRWIVRAGASQLDRVDWADRPSILRTVHRMSLAIKDRVLAVRRELQTASALSEYGAAAIHRELAAAGGTPVPALRTIGRILDRRGALDGRRRHRLPPPPRGWYLPAVATGGPNWTASTSSRAW